MTRRVATNELERSDADHHPARAGGREGMTNKTTSPSEMANEVLAALKVVASASHSIRDLHEAALAGKDASGSRSAAIAQLTQAIEMIEPKERP